MTTMSASQQSRLLLLPAEIRRNIYSHLLHKPNRELHFCTDCGHNWIDPDIPTQLLRVCAQINDEVAPLVYQFLAPLTLVLKDRSRHLRPWGRETCNGEIAVEARSLVLPTYGEAVRILQTWDFDDVHRHFEQMNELCPNVKKLILDCTSSQWSIYIDDGDEEEEDPEWWLTSPDVAPMLVPYWKEKTSEEGLEEEISLANIWKFLDRDARVYGVEVTAAFQMMEWDNQFFVRFDYDSDEILQRWFHQPYQLARSRMYSDVTGA